ncbi:MAG: HAD family phosphatase [Atopobiaceae bacterium]|nr:HAD family phosphatase [Atopobiaceae bacterium]
MAHGIRAILLDIDGTLTNSEKVITPRTREALLKAQEKGVVLVLASGRTATGLSTYAADLDLANHNGVLVCYNGAKSLNCQTGEVYFEQALTIEQGKRVLEHMKKFDVAPVIDHGEYMYVNDVFFSLPNQSTYPTLIIQYEGHSNNYLLCEKRDLAEFCDFPLNKILTAGDPTYLQEHWREMAAPFEGELSSMFTAPVYYEFTPLGVDKVRALKDTFEVLGIDQSEVMSFGDAQNDLTMIEWAEIGVAMGNAVDEVKAKADYVTLDNNSDGIAYALERLVPELLA